MVRGRLYVAHRTARLRAYSFIINTTRGGGGGRGGSGVIGCRGGNEQHTALPGVPSSSATAAGSPSSSSSCAPPRSPLPPLSLPRYRRALSRLPLSRRAAPRLRRVARLRSERFSVPHTRPIHPFPSPSPQRFRGRRCSIIPSEPPPRWPLHSSVRDPPVTRTDRVDDGRRVARETLLHRRRDAPRPLTPRAQHHPRTRRRQRHPPPSTDPDVLFFSRTPPTTTKIVFFSLSPPRSRASDDIPVVSFGQFVAGSSTRRHTQRPSLIFPLPRVSSDPGCTATLENHVVFGQLCRPILYGVILKCKKPKKKITYWIKIKGLKRIAPPIEIF